MREILFRGKRIDNGEWIEGFYVHVPCGRMCKDEHLIQTLKLDGRVNGLFNVDPETVGQFTGLTDKNGKKIFEGDIVCLYGELYNKIFSIVFAEGCFRLGTKNGYACTLHNLTSALEVIGNIHDNPELLKGGK